MSGRTNRSKSGGKSGKGNKGKSGRSTSNADADPPQLTVVSGWEYHNYSRDRYVYIGKDEDTGEPEFIDYGPSGGRG